MCIFVPIALFSKNLVTYSKILHLYIINRNIVKKQSSDHDCYFLVDLMDSANYETENMEEEPELIGE